MLRGAGVTLDGVGFFRAAEGGGVCLVAVGAGATFCPVPAVDGARCAAARGVVTAAGAGRPGVATFTSGAELGNDGTESASFVSGSKKRIGIAPGSRRVA